MRTRVSEIRETGRNAAGVRLIKLDDGDRLVAMAKVEVEEGENSEQGATGASPAPEPQNPTDGQPSSS
jgi:DNA gyrase subunit A